jgi:hypothetical protein
MEVKLAEERAFVITERITWEQAKERAWDKKGDAFGTFSKFLLRPKGEEIQITYMEKRYEPFWHVACHTRYEYQRNRRYNVPVSGPEVKRVSISDLSFGVDQTGAPHVAFTGTEHCLEDTVKESFFNGITGQDTPELKSYLQYAMTQITDIGQFAPENAMVVPPEQRASFLVRNLLSTMMKAVQADKILDESVEIQNIDLYYCPIYAFEYAWAAKGKTAVTEFNGLTGELRTNGKAMRLQLGKVLNRELLFDVGAETISMFVPGGGIAVKIVQNLTSKS